MKLFKRIGLLIIVMAMMFTMTSIGFAETDTKKWLESNITEVKSNGDIVTSVSWLKGFITGDKDKAESKTPIAQIGDNNVYLSKGKTKAELEEKIQIYIEEREKTSAEKVTGGLEIEPNTGDAVVILSGFVDYLEIGIGLMIHAITLGMTVFTAFDIAYIAFPVFRNKCEEVKASGKTSTMGMGKPSKSGGGTELRWVTQDAQVAVTEGSIESGKSPWGIYFRKRIVSYIMLAIILFILMTGNVSLITDIALSAVQGIMDVLSGLA